MFPPLGACVAARMHVMISSSLTGVSLKRRIARVVSSASKTSIGHRPLKTGGRFSRSAASASW